MVPTISCTLNELINVIFIVEGQRRDRFGIKLTIKKHFEKLLINICR